MDNNTEKLLEQLANKLGTTAEYLWQVLLKQSKVSATTDIFFFILVCIVGVVLWKVHMRLSKEDKEDSYSQNLYEKHEFVYALPMIILALVWAGFLIGSLCTMPNIINGYLNSEYWALKEVLDTIKN